MRSRDLKRLAKQAKASSKAASVSSQSGRDLNQRVET